MSVSFCRTYVRRTFSMWISCGMFYICPVCLPSFTLPASWCLCAVFPLSVFFRHGVLTVTSLSSSGFPSSTLLHPVCRWARRRRALAEAVAGRAHAMLGMWRGAGEGANVSQLPRWAEWGSAPRFQPCIPVDVWSSDFALLLVHKLRRPLHWNTSGKGILYVLGQGVALWASCFTVCWKTNLPKSREGFCGHIQSGLVLQFSHGLLCATVSKGYTQTVTFLKFTHSVSLTKHWVINCYLWTQ